MAESIDIRELNERIESQSSFVTNLTTGMNQVIVGQRHLIDSLLISLLSDGHILLEGVPGLAKHLLSRLYHSLLMHVIVVFSLLQTCFLLTLWVHLYTLKKKKSSKLRKDQYLQTLYWQMKLTVLLQKFRALC